MKVKGIDHIGIAVESLQKAMEFYRDRLGLEFQGIEEVPSQKVRVAVFSAGESKIELLEPTSQDSPIAKALAKRGEGIHHIALSVDCAAGAVRALTGSGVRMIDNEPRPGAGGTRIAFIHPASTGRVLVELCEHPQGEGGNGE